MKAEDFQKAYAKLVEKAWSDKEFKTRLMTDPKTVFKENGIQVPPGIEIRMLEDTHEICHLILPRQPKGIKMTPGQWMDITGTAGNVSTRYDIKSKWN